MKPIEPACFNYPEMFGVSGALKARHARATKFDNANCMSYVSIAEMFGAFPRFKSAPSTMFE